MKKFFVLSMALLLCVMSVFVGCTKEEVKDEETTAETTAEETTAENTTAQDTTAEDTTAENADTSADAGTTADTSDGAGTNGSTEENAALAAFAAEQQKPFDAVQSELYSVSCSARGNALVYSYKYAVIDAATAQATLNNTLDATYASMLTAVQLTVPSCESIIVEILDQSGTVLASKTY